MTNSRPAELHHYTSMAGLAGMVNSACLWATRVDELNDTTELKYARDALAVALHQRASEMDPWPEDTRGEDFRHMAGRPENIDGLGSWLERDQEDECFVVCFSELDDDFGMWRKFDAEVSISFRSESLPQDRIELESEYQGESMGGAGWIDPDLMPVQYLRKDDEARRGILITKIVDDIVLASPPFADKAAALTGLAAIKNFVFASDAEWRLFLSRWVYPGSGNPSYYPKVASVGKHFVEVPFKLGAITAVTVAPSPASDKAAERVASILGARGMQAEVRKSAVPLRFALNAPDNPVQAAVGQPAVALEAPVGQTDATGVVPGGVGD